LKPSVVPVKTDAQPAYAALEVQLHISRTQVPAGLDGLSQDIECAWGQHPARTLAGPELPGG